MRRGTKVAALVVLAGAASWGCRRGPPSSGAAASAASDPGPPGVAAASPAPARPAGAGGAAPGASAVELAPVEAEALALAPPGAGDDTARAVARSQDAVRRAPGVPGPWIALGRAWVQRARSASDPGLYLNADACAVRALALAPAAPGALALRGAVHLNAHRFEDARVAAEAALRGAPEDLVALGVLSDALVELGRYDDAVTVTDRMLALKPGLPAYVRASWLEWLHGRVGPALASLRQAIDAAGPGEPRAWTLTQAAWIFWHRGDLDGADAGFERALAASPGYPPALVGKGRVALARGDARAAVAALERAFAASAHAETAWLLGDARGAAGDAAGAEAAFAEVVRLGRAGDGRVLAQFLAAHGREAGEAVRLAQAELRVRPDVYGDDALAWALYRAGRLAEARAASDRAIRLGTPDARLLWHAGAIRLAEGDRRGAALVRRALSLNPAFDPVGAPEARRLLSGMRLARDAPRREGAPPRTPAAAAGPGRSAPRRAP